MPIPTRLDRIAGSTANAAVAAIVGPMDRLRIVFLRSRDDQMDATANISMHAEKRIAATIRVATSGDIRRDKKSAPEMSSAPKPKRASNPAIPYRIACRFALFAAILTSVVRRPTSKGARPPILINDATRGRTRSQCRRRWPTPATASPEFDWSHRARATKVGP